MNWSYSESNIASYYNLYLDLMNYWNGKFGNEIYEMNEVNESTGANEVHEIDYLNELNTVNDVGKVHEIDA